MAGRNAAAAARVTSATLSTVWGDGIGELAAPGFPWRTLCLGIGVYLLRGVGLSHISEILDSIRVALVGIGLFAFAGAFGMVVGALLQRSIGHLKIVVAVGATLFFAALQVLPAFGSWIGAQLLGPEPLAGHSLGTFIPAWLNQYYFRRFALAQSFWQSVSGYDDMFGDVDGLMALLAAVITFIINFIPDYAMYSIADGSSDPSLGALNFAVSTIYWLGFSALFARPGYIMARNFDESVGENEKFFDDLEKPGPRYAVLCNAGTGGRDESPDGTLIGTSQFFAFRTPPLHESEYFDTGGTAAGAAAAAEAAIKAEFPIVFGPIGREEARGAVPVLRKAGVPAITFTHDEDMLGDSAYSLAWRTEDELSTIISYARRELAITQFATLLPATIGQSAFAALNGRVSAAGGRLVAAGAYGLGVKEDEAVFFNLLNAMRNRVGLIMMDPEFAAACLAYFARLNPRPVAPQILGIGAWYEDSGVKNYDPRLQGSLFAAPQGFDGSLRSHRALKPYALHGSEIVWLAEQLQLVGEHRAKRVRKRLQRSPTLKLGGNVTLRPGKLALRELAIFEIKDGYAELRYPPPPPTDDEVEEYSLDV